MANSRAVASNELDSMLKAWQTTRAAALADAIQVADRDRWTKRFATAARAKKGLAMGYLNRLPDDDPRVAVFLIQCLQKARWPGPTAKNLWATIFDKLAVLEDGRTVAPLRDAAAHPPPILGQAHAKWLS